ncbi:hypothetical protein DL89DRAFT_139847 [Linderina pennispora]|uniref:Uncharacterized protein n=1 Tax=Linderina pennispora TaxID=61395 RepID=A0A1Y1WB54_9FUNG|nr:uncharacterized protein DL89DRAFT_139847 [Linderina pennispora]ORX70761.1 hypothetical protein DL89DRAFT_139847 [Linderina pennispora]
MSGGCPLLRRFVHLGRPSTTTMPSLPESATAIVIFPTNEHILFGAWPPSGSNCSSGRTKERRMGSAAAADYGSCDMGGAPAAVVHINTLPTRQSQHVGDYQPVDSQLHRRRSATFLFFVRAAFAMTIFFFGAHGHCSCTCLFHRSDMGCLYFGARLPALIFAVSRPLSTHASAE